MTPDIHLRIATQADSSLLLSWRNDPETVKFSIHTKPVSPEEHYNWLNRVLANPDIKLCIIEYGGQPAGTIRQELRQGDTVISWTTAPQFRGKGIATAALSAFIRTAPATTLVAEIKEDNVASIKVAEKAGLSFSHKEGGLLYYIKKTA
ncbi:GNAT family N-acetyltransferase [Chromatiaceae bacterium AAb-1]|nr:GNAT family N-acetyltransferase [Chromatiaceae bacterium AAb-1]